MCMNILIYDSHIRTFMFVYDRHIWVFPYTYMSTVTDSYMCMSFFGIWRTYMIKLDYHMSANIWSYVHVYDLHVYDSRVRIWSHIWVCRHMTVIYESVYRWDAAFNLLHTCSTCDHALTTMGSCPHPLRLHVDTVRVWRVLLYRISRGPTGPSTHPFFQKLSPRRASYPRTNCANQIG